MGIVAANGLVAKRKYYLSEFHYLIAPAIIYLVRLVKSPVGTLANKIILQAYLPFKNREYSDNTQFI